MGTMLTCAACSLGRSVEDAAANLYKATGVSTAVWEILSHKALPLHALRRLLLQLDEECPKPLDKYELLTQIAASNVTLLYYVLIRHLADLAPIVYTWEHQPLEYNP